MLSTPNEIDRSSAAEQLDRLGFPAAQSEAWRYSRISAYAKRDWGENLSGSVASLVLESAEPNVFIHMNRAKSQIGYRVINQEVVLQHNVTSQHEHNLIQLASGQRAVVVESLSTADKSVGTSLTEVELAPGAELIRLQMRRHGADSAHVNHTAVKVAGGATFTNIDFTRGGGLSRNEIQVQLLAEQAQANLYGTYLLRGQEHADTHTHIAHRAPETYSREIYKGVVADRARGVFQGKIRVDQHAQKIEGHQLSRGLILSPRARIDVKPELEIFADDVMCSHGATIGDLDEQQLFYLRARGLDAQTAKAMLVQAFVAEIIDLMPSEIDHDGLLTEIAKWLTGSRS